MADYTRQIAIAAEAVCSSLHRLNFDFMGETNGGASTWFRRGEKPKHVRIEVVRSALAPMVMVNIEFYNVAGTPGRITGQVDVRGGEIDVFQATENAVLRVLEIYRDVIQGSGVAGPLPETVHSTEASNVPETDDEIREAGLDE